MSAPPPKFAIGAEVRLCATAVDLITLGVELSGQQRALLDHGTFFVARSSRMTATGPWLYRLRIYGGSSGTILWWFPEALLRAVNEQPGEVEYL